MIEKNELIDAELDTVSGGHFRKDHDHDGERHEHEHHDHDRYYPYPGFGWLFRPL